MKWDLKICERMLRRQSKNSITCKTHDLGKKEWQILTFDKKKKKSTNHESQKKFYTQKAHHQILPLSKINRVKGWSRSKKASLIKQFQVKDERSNFAAHCIQTQTGPNFYTEPFCPHPTHSLLQQRHVIIAKYLSFLQEIKLTNDLIPPKKTTSLENVSIRLTNIRKLLHRKMKTEDWRQFAITLAKKVPNSSSFFFNGVTSCKQL